MTVIGEAFVVVKSIVESGFADDASRQVAGSGFAGKIEDQFAKAGALSGDAFTQNLTSAVGAGGIGDALTQPIAQAASELGATTAQAVASSGVADDLAKQFEAAGVESGVALIEPIAKAATEIGTTAADAVEGSDLRERLTKQFEEAGAQTGKALTDPIEKSAKEIAGKTTSAVEGGGLADSLSAQFANFGLLAGNSFTDKLLNVVQNLGLKAKFLGGAALALGVGAALNQIASESGRVRGQLVKDFGASSKSIAGLFDAVKRSAKEVPVSLEQAGIAFTGLFKRGVPLGPLLDALARKQLLLAKITKTDLGANVATTTAIMDKFNIPIREQGKALDVLFKASQRSGVGLAEFIEPLKSGGAALQEFGFDLAESAALIAQLQIAGVNVQPALGALRKAFAQLAQEGRDPQQALADLVAEFKSGENPTKAMADAMQLFGARAGLELATAIRTGKFEVTDLVKQITDGKDGILATGAATQSLGDRFTLLKNRSQEAFAGLAAAVRGGLKTVVVEASGPIEALARGVGRLIQSVAPLGVLFAPFVAVLGAILPAVNIFATGIDTIAAGLERIPDPVLIVAGALGALAIASTTAAGGLIRAAEAAADVATSLAAEHPVLAGIIAAIAAVGLAVTIFAKDTDPAIKVSKDLASALIDSESASTIFRSGIDSATEGVRLFIDAQIRAGEGGDTERLLQLTGATTAQLTSALTGGADAWEAFVKGSVRAVSNLPAVRAGFVDATAISIETALALDELRRGFELFARGQLDAAVDTGILTEAQKRYVLGQNKARDGSVDYGAVLDEVNRRLADSIEKHNDAVLSTKETAVAVAELTKQFAAGALSEKDLEAALVNLGLEGDGVTEQLDKIATAAAELNLVNDRAALSTLTVSKAYGELARQIATGVISESAATAALEGMGLSAAGASTAFGDLKGSVEEFVSGALGQLPTIGQAIADFAADITTAEQKLESDQQKGVELREKLGEAVAKSSEDTRRKLAAINAKIVADQQAIASGSVSTTTKLQADLVKRSEIIADSGKASQQLRDEIVANNAEITADFKKLAESQDPNKFTQTLIDNAVKVATFLSNLQTLVRLGFGELAGELAKQGPQAAAGLAASLAGSPAKAAIASKAAELGKATTDAYQAFLEEKFPELTGVGAKQGLAIGRAIADGITRQLVENFPFLRFIGVTSGDQFLAGSKEGASTSSITDPMLTAARRHIPEFRGLGVEVGTAVHTSARNTLDTTDIATPILTAARRHLPEFRGLGVEVGTEAGEGIVEGIRSQFDAVGDAVLAITQHGVAVARGAWKVTSPSKVFAEIGAEVGAGLAVGIAGTDSRGDVATAARLLASEVTTSVDDAVGRLTFDPTFAPKITPEITPTVVFGSIPPVDVMARLAAVAAPEVDPVVLAATFAPVEPPAVTAPVELIGRFTPPDVDPVDLVGRFVGRVAAPTVDPVTLAGRFGPVAAPSVGTVDLVGRLQPFNVAPVPVDLVASIPPFDVVDLVAQFGPIEPPDIDPVVIAASLAPLVVPPLPPFAPLDVDVAPIVAPIDPVVIAASFGPLRVPSLSPLDVSIVPKIDPVVIATSLAPLPPVPPLPPLPPLDLTFAPFDPPLIDPVVVSASLSPLTVPPLPTIDVVLAPLVPLIDPVIIAASLAPLVVPPLPPLDVTLAPIVPDVAPVIVGATLAPLVVPPLAPLDLRFAPFRLPAIDPVVVAASLAPLVVPPLPPLAVALAPIVPDIDPVVIGASLAPLVVPPFPPLDVALTPIVPNIDPVVIAASLSPLVVPPLELTPVVGPLVLPAVDPVTIAASFGPVRPPTLPDVAPLVVRSILTEPAAPQLPTLAPVTIGTLFEPPRLPPALQPIDPVAISTLFADPATFVAPPITPVVIRSSIAKPAPPLIDPVIVAASLAPLTVPPIPALDPITLAVQVAVPDLAPVELPASLTVSPPLLDPVVLRADLGPVTPPRFDPIDLPLVVPPVTPPIISPAFAPDAARLISSAVSASVTDGLSAVSFGDVDVSGPVDQIATAFTESLDRAGDDAGTAADRLAAIVRRSFADDAIVDPDRTPGQGILDGFRKSFGQVHDEAEQLRRFLLALGGTRFAPEQPPSALSIREAATSIPVPRPEDRINAQQPTGLFAGATLNFPTNADPLHIAAELAWQSDLQTSIGG